MVDASAFVCVCSNSLTLNILFISFIIYDDVMLKSILNFLLVTWIKYTNIINNYFGTQECFELYEQVLEAAPHKAAAVRPPPTHHKKLSKLDEPDMPDTVGEVRTNS